MKVFKHRQTGFTLIELMVVMSIVALLMGMVGPLAINSLEKAQAKQEMLSLKNWFRKVSARAFNTGQQHTIKLTGKQVALYVNKQGPVESVRFEFLFFQPQTLHFSTKGFVEPLLVTGSYRGSPLTLELAAWINGHTLNEQQLQSFAAK
ncbi:pilus assembly FimT family protein [Thalassomonas haliotis]|uniref:Type II secretion system protein n=1 Tax=Thalassomonas haliotis TaxID=485448 RepID=A0ABY7VHQ9_9GAMM|nr:type II secretion system protein [Thalassomonas haliotis]WDE13265.1 type II secretion system protein [Thalassomonas haliotis]